MAKTTKTTENTGVALRTEIVWLPVDSILTHPKNPRRDLGDLSELADSIKSNGVLQNLTVVPWYPMEGEPAAAEPEYYAVIGNRRHAAARLAGLTEVPCVVAKMSEKQQVGTMLTENVQRSDLSIIEQADGFQMLLDLGDTVSSIAENTGFSASTVRRRIKLQALDREKLLASMERGVTLDDYAELDKVKDAKTRDALLECIGLSNFAWKLREAIEQEEREARFAPVRERLDSFATRAASTSGYEYVSSIGDTEVDFPIPEDADTRKYVYTKGYYYKLYREAGPKDAATDEEAAAIAEQKAREAEMALAREALSARAYKLRYAFIKNFGNHKRFAAEIMCFAAQVMIKNGGYYRDKRDMADLFGIKRDKDTRDTDIVDAVAELAEESPERTLLLCAYFLFADNAKLDYFDWDGAYESKASLDMLYDLLESLGYECNDEERAFRDGTHELFAEDEEQEDDE